MLKYTCFTIAKPSNFGSGLFTLPEHVTDAFQHAFLGFGLVFLVLPASLLLPVVFAASPVHPFLHAGRKGEVGRSGNGVAARSRAFFCVFLH